MIAANIKDILGILDVLSVLPTSLDKNRISQATSSFGYLAFLSFATQPSLIACEKAHLEHLGLLGVPGFASLYVALVSQLFLRTISNVLKTCCSPHISETP